MKVRINSQCMGDRNCNKLCPEVFEYDEDQLLSVVKFEKNKILSIADYPD
jgi:ferredoxin